ncbi:MAG: MAPEG family protein [Hyphomicrobiaceae bacterium]|nr:MAPEG family protein [Hyphomicrobiaceae bacterium]
MPITAVYASLLAVLFVVLSLRVILVRRGARVSLGDGGDDELLRRMRVHGNFAEYVPLALVLMGLAESLKLEPLILHGLGLTLLAARICHAVGLSPSPSIMPLRVAGMALTFTVIVTSAIACVGRAFVRAGLVD